MKTLSIALLLALTLHAQSAVISYTYDAAGRLTGVNYNGTSNTAYGYDKNGSLLSRVNTTNPLPPLAANYSGLIANAAPGIANTGAISVKLLATGAFTGKLVLGGKPFTFKGTFAADGSTAPILITRKPPLGNLTLALALDVDGGTNQITGTLTDGTFTSQLALDRARYDAKSPAPGGLVGAHTLLFQPTTADLDKPQGHGYGAAKLTGTGSITLAVTLADGTKFGAGGSLSGAGTFPIFVGLYKNGGLLAGTLTFATDPGVSDFSGTLDWLKPQTTTGLYQAGFVTEIDCVGSQYVVPPKGQRVLDLAAGPNNARLTAAGPAPLDKLVTLDAANKFIVPVDPILKLKLTLASPAGIFSGSYSDGITTFKFGGAIFQEQNIGGGFVSGATTSGPTVIAAP